MCYSLYEYYGVKFSLSPLSFSLSLSLSVSLLFLSPLLSQIDRIEQFFVADGHSHIMFYYQDVDLPETGTEEKGVNCRYFPLNTNTRSFFVS